MKQQMDVLMRMMEYERGCSQRVHHFIKVLSFAEMIAKAENVDETTLHIIKIAAIVHDIGIRPSLEKYGNCLGKNQEKEGSAFAKSLLEELNYVQSTIDRVCYLVGHHHSYSDIKDIDYQILVEADFLVNILDDEMSKDVIRNIYHNIFQTKTGKQILEKIYFSEEESGKIQID